ncbi:MAG TPA: DUF883 C-terminal domain-containing protein [Gammaproteobacteria bacterium]|nr:DUF883 C-terminal domain-containing protein [Gammaproteobacteria bacterium]
MATTEQDIQTLKSDFGSLRRDVAELTSAIKNLVVDESRVGYEKIKETTGKSVRQVEHEIEEHPFASVGIAMGVGFLIGVLLDRLTR